MPIKQHFLDWHRPILHSAVDYLMQGWTRGLLDLSDTLVVVPTLNAGRRLREHLAYSVSEKGAAVTPPATVSPEGLFNMLVPGKVPAADSQQALAVMVHVLQELDLHEYPGVFPTPPLKKDFTWLLGAARTFCRLKHELAEAGLTIQQCLPLFGDEFEEVLRWEELAELEQRYQAMLGSVGLQDPALARRAMAERPELQVDVKRILVFGTPDPNALVARLLEQLSETLPVTVCICAPEALADTFDAAGRPLVEHWEKRPIDIGSDRIHLCADPDTQAAKACEIFCATKAAPLDCAVGMPDTTLAPAVKHAFEEHGIATYSPAGEPAAQHPIVELLRRVCDFFESTTYDSFAALLRHPHFLDWFCSTSAAAGPAQILNDLDRLQNSALPQSFAAVTEALEHRSGYDGLRGICAQCARLLQEYEAENEPDVFLREFLARVYQDVELDPQKRRDKEFITVAGGIADVFEGTDVDFYADLGFDGGERLALLLAAVMNLTVYEDRHRDSLDLEGWLELLWEDAPNLILAGMNDGIVPETIVGDVFLPDSVRAKLDLKNNRRRFSRDVYLLSAMLAMRDSRAVHFLLGKRSEDGDVLRPSRLFFLCDDRTLVQRAQQLFSDPDEEGAAVPRRKVWKLTPPKRPAPDRLAVTAFRDYLACPFRFYLKRVLRMEEIDDRKMEMDAADFGNICHEALKRFGENERLRDSFDAAEIQEFLDGQLHNIVSSCYGRRLPAAVQIQMESARQRLFAFARVQAEERLAGWHITDVEYQLHDARIGGMQIRGTIDRIETNDDGRVRVLDYKTSDRADPPDKAHLGSVNTDLDLDAACVEVRGKEKQWIDLQLPLYAVLLGKSLGQVPECGYLNLPKAVTETGVRVWTGLEADLLESAHRCAEAVVEAVRGGRFWPPSGRVRYDSFDEIFFDTAADSVCPDFIATEAPETTGSQP